MESLDNRHVPNTALKMVQKKKMLSKMKEAILLLSEKCKYGMFRPLNGNRGAVCSISDGTNTRGTVMFEVGNV